MELLFILFLFSAVVGFWVFTQLHTLQHRQEFLLWLFHFELLLNLVKVCSHWKNLSSVLIYLYRSWCSMCKQLHRGISLKNSFQTLLYAFQKIIHYFRSTICHSHILIRNDVEFFGKHIGVFERSFFKERPRWSCLHIEHQDL